MKRIFILFTILATSYVALNAQNCNNQDDYTALRALYLSTNGDSWNNQVGANDPWPDENFFNMVPNIGPSNDMSGWYGVTCTNGRVTGLDLSLNNLDGTLPAELGLLTELEELNLTGNNLSDTIPSELGQLSNLTLLALGDNVLTGPIPDSLVNLTNLVSLLLHNNMLSGSFPLWLTTLTNLEQLNISQNMLTGTLPEELSNLINLQVLALDENNFEGFIPNTLTSLTNLSFLDLANNSLVGCPDAALTAYLCGLSSFTYEGNPGLADICAPDYEPAGTACDDEDPATENDIIREDCSCRGDCTEPFMAMCNDITMGASVFPGEILATTLLDGVLGNCGYSYIPEVRRMDPAQGPEDNWGSSIAYSCDDMPEGVIVYELRAVDINGRISSVCMDTIRIQEKEAPEVVEPLADVEVSCTIFPGLLDLADADFNVFGTYVLDPDSVTTIGYDVDLDGIVDLEVTSGVVSDACMDISGISVAVDTSGLNECGYGTFTRTFTFTDINGNESTDVQTITVLQNDLFDPTTDVVIPGMYVHNACTAPDPSISGEPVILDQGCSKMVMSYRDELFVHPSGGCDKIVRTWALIDCCNPEGMLVARYEYEQVIKLADETVPVLDTAACEPYVFDITTDTCEHEVNLAVTATDSCAIDELTFTYELNIDGAGFGEVVTSNTFNEVLPIGNHELRWTVTDKCGNTDQCIQPITINDAKPPVYAVIDGLVTNIILMVNGTDSVYMATVDAAMFVKNTAIDNCSPSENITFSFSSDPSDSLRVYDCSDVGAQVVTIYGTDLSGNQTFMTTNLTVEGTVCPTGNIQGIIAGKVETPGHTALEGVNVQLFAPEHIHEYASAADGSFSFENLPLSDDYMVKIDQEALSYKEGVSTIDLVKIQQHILGLGVFDNPYTVLAADVDGSKSVTPVDLLELRKVILGVSSAFSGGKSWKYFAADHTIDNPMEPWDADEAYHINNLNEQMEDVNFVAVKMGDVNGSMEDLLQEKADTRNSSTLDLIAHAAPDETHIKTAYTSKLHAIQFTMPIPDEEVTIASPVLNITDEHYHISGDVLTFAWYSVDPVTIEAGETLLSITGTPEVTFNSRITEAIAYDEREERLKLRLIPAEHDFAVAQNTPNPFVHTTEVTINLSASTSAQLIVHDAQGKELARSIKDLTAGENRVQVDFIPENYNGLVFLHVQTEYGIQTIKMIKLQ